MVWGWYEDEGGEDNKKISAVAATGKETRGRPHKRWLDGIDEALKRRGEKVKSMFGSGGAK